LYKGLISRIYRKLKIEHQGANTPCSKSANEFRRWLSKEEAQMANIYMKKCSISLAIREKQITVKLQYNLIPVKMGIIKKTNNNKCW
jgi:hypothetical protein